MIGREAADAGSENHCAVGAVQAACLGIVTLGTLLYTVSKSRIRTHTVPDF